MSRNIQRIDIYGHPLTAGIQASRCGECGMGTVSAAEFHPYRACEVYKATHDSREVWRDLYRGGHVHALLERLAARSGTPE